jgi:hypothetical protein
MKHLLLSLIALVCITGCTDKAKHDFLFYRMNITITYENENYICQERSRFADEGHSYLFAESDDPAYFMLIYRESLIPEDKKSSSFSNIGFALGIRSPREKRAFNVDYDLLSPDKYSDAFCCLATSTQGRDRIDKYDILEAHISFSDKNKRPTSAIDQNFIGSFDIKAESQFDHRVICLHGEFNHAIGNQKTLYDREAWEKKKRNVTYFFK